MGRAFSARPVFLFPSLGVGKQLTTGFAVLFLGMDFIVPITLKLVASDVECGKLRIAYLLAFGILSLVQPCVNLQALRRPRRSNQIHDDLVRFQRDALPIAGDVTEQAMLNLVPFARAGGKWQTSTIIPVRLANR
jgi:hypothetical protein